MVPPGCLHHAKRNTPGSKIVRQVPETRIVLAACCQGHSGTIPITFLCTAGHPVLFWGHPISLICDANLGTKMQLSSFCTRGDGVFHGETSIQGGLAY